MTTTVYGTDGRLIVYPYKRSKPEFLVRASSEARCGLISAGSVYLPKCFIGKRIIMYIEEVKDEKNKRVRKQKRKR